ncbi:hypothetical protein [Methylomicrobium sp. Wu6]|uniref:hypothetical protein n=1 Tax=Methylomicrobium sp. Wu6 TaxID=3107928 RepID=UPI002DD68639|nr:hypothetical protein [Methylomicrobium sp. Wu6]MEC4749431.1 hypothetical protein [Methylomicrobium sp. Wu6]
MTAGNGIMHEALHYESFTRPGGMLEMVQFWVNLPAAHMMTWPKYQSIPNQAIPEIELPRNTGTVRVIAGSHGGATWPALTF